MAPKRPDNIPSARKSIDHRAEDETTKQTRTGDLI